MAGDLESLKSQVLKLSDDSRARLAAFLLESLEPPGEPKSDQWWLEEADRRDRELASGAVKGRPWEDVLAKAKQRLEPVGGPSVNWTKVDNAGFGFEILVSVSDTGPGIREKTKIFDLFFQGRDR